MIKLLDILLIIKIEIETKSKKIKFSKPDFDQEWGEAKRYPKLFKNKKEWFQIAETGKEESVDCSMNIQNTDMCEDNLEDLDSEKVLRAKKAIEKGEVELPIVLKIGKKYELLGGNTRLTALKKYGYPTKAWMIHIKSVKNK